MTDILVDSYDLINKDAEDLLSSTNNVQTMQSFTGRSGNLIISQFYIKKTGSPAGNAVAKLYAHSGTYGISSLPTGAALATSDNVDVATLSESFSLINFAFTGAQQYELVDGTHYVISVEYAGGDGSNYVNVGVDMSDPTHDGNYSFEWYDNSQEANNAIDLIFYIHATEITPYAEPAHQILSIAKPVTLKTAKEINGFWGANMQILPDDYIGVENYIDIDGEEYIVKNLKKIKDSGKHYYDVSLYHNAIEELTASSIDRFSLTKSVEDLLTLILAGSGWTAGTVDIDEIIIAETDRRVTRLYALNLLADKCGGELYFHSKTRIVDLKRQIGTDTKLQLRYDKNCTYMEKEEDSTDLVTRIYPLGSDNQTINTTVIDNCEDETLYTASGAGTKVASTFKMNGTQGIQINPAALNETFIRDLGAVYTIDLSGHDLAKFWIYSAVDNAAGFTFGIGETAYTENTVNTGALTAGCWHEIELDLSGVADASKNAIRYIGFKNLTNGAAEAVFDSIRAFNGDIFIDSPNIGLYKVNKEYVYHHSSKAAQTQFEVIIYPSDDASVYENAPNTNFGSEGTMYVRGPNTKIYEAYKKFDISEIPVEATILEAGLYLEVTSTGQSGRYATTFRVNADWNESTITWNNRAAVTGADLHTWDFSTTGAKNSGTDLLTLVQNWFSGAWSNYGIRLKEDSGAYSTPIGLATKEASTGKPYLKIVYTLAVDPYLAIKTAAMDYLSDHDEPKLSYKIKMADLSKVMVDTWEGETIDLGDTVRVYDAELGLNVDVRVHKITKNILDPTDVDLELANKAYSLADIEAKRAKQLSYAMPYEDNPTIISANSVQQGFLGSDVG